MRSTFIHLLLGIASIGGMLALPSSSTSRGEGGFSRAAFEKTMEESNTKLRILVGTLIAGDWAKAQSSAKAMSAEASVIRGLTPKTSPDRIGEFQAFADSLIAQSGRVEMAAKGRNVPASTEELGKVIQTCMGCHQVFRR